MCIFVGRWSGTGRGEKKHTSHQIEVRSNHQGSNGSNGDVDIFFFMKKHN
jgi:hypothetical protein